MDWNLILNWKLLSGSHKFPGPDGGTCINEAAIVAAGFKYRGVSSAADCPPCFSRAVASYALQLNDEMGDELRQELLMPYVVRLAGTADTREIEIARAQHITLETIRRILPSALRVVRLKECAARCADAKDLRGAKAAAEAAKTATYAAMMGANAASANAASAAANAASAAAKAASANAAYAAMMGAEAADGYAHNAATNAAYAAMMGAEAADVYAHNAATNAAKTAAYAASAAAIAASAAAKAASANAASAAANAASAAAKAASANAASAAAKAASAAAASATAKAAAAAAEAATSAYAANAYAAHREIFTIAVAILDEAICLGRQADPIEIGVVRERMEAARLTATVAENV